LNNPIWPDAQPYDSYIFLAISVVVVVLNRRRLLTREGAPTQVVPPKSTVVGDLVASPGVATPHEDRAPGVGAPVVP